MVAIEKGGREDEKLQMEPPYGLTEGQVITGTLRSSSPIPLGYP